MSSQSPPIPRITVAAALQLPELRRGLPEVVAGADSLDRPIRWAHAGEVPDIASLLRGGELLLTTGMGIGARASDQRRFIAQLAERELAGLVVELGHTFVDALPDALVRAAEQHGLPLIELHATVRFVAVTEAIHTEIVSHDYELLRRAERLHQRFTTLMLQGGGIPDVMTLLAETLRNPAFLESDDGRLLAYAAPPGGQDDGDPVTAWSDARGAADAVGVTAMVPGEGSRSVGRLLVLPVEAALDPFAPLALERAAAIVALALLRTRQEDELLALGRGDLLAKLLDGRIDPALAAARAGDMGFVETHAGALLPLAARLVVDRAGGATSSWTAALRDIERGLAAIGVPRLVGVDAAEGGALVLLGLRDADDRAAVADRAAAVIRDAARARANADVVVAVGAAAGWSAVADGLRDANEATAVAVQLPPRPWYDATAMPLERLLWRLRDNDDLRRYVDRLLGPVLAHDARRRHPLLPTLEALCEHGGRKAETARALHLNRQALYDRIARLERVLGADLADAETLSALHLAIRARRQAHARGAVASG